MPDDLPIPFGATRKQARARFGSPDPTGRDFDSFWDHGLVLTYAAGHVVRIRAASRSNAHPIAPPILGVKLNDPLAKARRRWGRPTKAPPRPVFGDYMTYEWQVGEHEVEAEIWTRPCDGATVDTIKEISVRARAAVESREARFVRLFTARKRPRVRIDLVDHLVLPTGRIVACDPLFAPGEARPFARRVPPGRYPVYASEVASGIAGVYVRFTKDAILRWEPVARGSFAVETGFAAIMDETARRALANCSEPPMGSDPEWVAGSVKVDARSNANLVYFTSGAGDGVYACVWGLSARGKLARLAIDFGLLQ
jgi:hypothetical protein